MKRGLFLLAILLCLPLSGEGSPDANKQGSGGAGGVPGLSGSTGNDLTLNALFAAQTFEAMPDWPRIYVSRENNNAPAAGAAGCLPGPNGCWPVGVDTNPGTMEQPIRSITAAVAYLNRQKVIVVMDSEDSAWITAGAGTDWGTGTDHTLSTTGCGTGTSGTLTDEPCGFWIASNPNKPVVVDCTNINPATNSIMSFVGTGSGYFGIAGINPTHCPREPKDNNVFWDTQNNAHGVIVNSMNLEISGGFENHAYAEAQSGVCSGCGLVLINSGAEFRDDANWDENSGATNPTATKCENFNNPWECCHADSANACAGGGRAGLNCDDNTDCPASTCTLGDAGDSQCGAATHAFEVTSSDWAIISQRQFHITNTQLPGWVDQIGVESGKSATHDCFLLEPPAGTDNPDVTIIGPWCRGPASLAASGPNSATAAYCASAFVAQAAETSPVRMRLARMLCAGWPAVPSNESVGVKQFNGSAVNPNAMEFILHQNTVADMAVGVGDSGQFGGDTISYSLTGNLFDTLRTVAGNAYVFAAQGGANNGVVSVDADGSNVYDAITGTYNSFSLQGTSYTHAGLVPDSQGGYNANTFFFGTNDASEQPNEIALLTTGGDAFSGFAASFFGVGTEVKDRVTVPRYIALPPYAFVPTAVLGAKITGFTLGTHFKNAGAR